MSKKQKTVEDLMEEALISEEEQLHEVPENWLWAKLGHVFEQGKEQIQPTGKENYVGLEHMNKGGGILEVVNSEGIKSKKVIFKKNDVLYGKLRPYLNKHAFVEFEGVASTDILVFRNKNKITNKLLNWYLGLPHVIEYSNKNSNGINLPRVSPKAMNDMAFPLPPLNEQKRIVEKVERLLNKIEEAKQLVEEAKEMFELRRVAFVNTLFEESSIKQMVNISDIADVKGGKRLPKGEALVNEDTGFPYIKAGDLKNGTVLMDKLQFLLPSTQEKIKNYIVSAGDVYITIVGACIGDVGVIPQEVDGANLTENAAKLTNLKDCLPEYLALWLSSNKAQNLIKESIASATLGKLSLTRIKNLPIPLFDRESQLRIVDKYESFIEKEKKTAQNLDRIDLDVLKGSILSKAFRGELGTNDPSEENAIGLLKELLQEQVK